MKRRLFKLAAFLLLGAIVNVAVAWGCVVWTDCRPFEDIPVPAPGSVPGSESDVAWLKHNGVQEPRPHPEFGPYCFGTSSFRSSGLSRMAYFFIPDMRGKGGGLSGRPDWFIPVASRLVAGLPCAALQSTSFDDWKIIVPVVVDFGAGQIDKENRTLPVRPLWLGFAINTIFYAAILAVMYFGPGKVRRFVRVRRGRCPACGFIIAPGTCANGLCSECGAALPTQLIKQAR